MKARERMRLSALIEWLTQEEGLSEYNVRKLVRTGQIKGHTLPGDTRKYYTRSQVERDVLPAVTTTA